MRQTYCIRSCQRDERAMRLGFQGRGATASQGHRRGDAVTWTAPKGRCATKEPKSAWRGGDRDGRTPFSAVKESRIAL
eukprot:scaffold80857_cov69-Attheya_sp.AAC.1